MKPVQYLSNEYLARCSQATPHEIAEYLEQFRLMQGTATIDKPKSKLISLKVKEDLLATFRAKCDVQGLKYQTQIKLLMQQWMDSVE